MSFTFGSLFAGIGGLDRGLELAGFECKWQVEFDPHCQQVLARHWPHVRRFGDVTQVKGKDLERVDLIVGGWPCQDLSVAGNRAGLAGQRSGLFFEFMRIVDELTPSWILAENVPGLLSAGCRPKCPSGCVETHGGAMGTVIGSLAERGYGYAWRVLDAQYVGLAQRRKRVFIVGHLGEPWSAPAQVLLEQESLSWDSQPRRTTEQEAARESEEGTGSDSVVAPEVSGTLGGGSGNRGWADDLDRAGAFIGYPDPGRALLSPNRGLRYDLESETLAYAMFPETGSACSTRAVETDVAPALTSTAEAKSTDRGMRIVQAFAENQRAEVRTSDIQLQLTTGGGKPGQGYPAIHVDEAPVGYVRRLTPVECERLQGFPDDWTILGADGKKISNSKRYKMCGNAVAVNCSEWIGHRLADVMTQVREDYNA